MQPRYSPLVYIFHGDAGRIKRNPGKKWNLYGLRTHSSNMFVKKAIALGTSLGLSYLVSVFLKQTRPEIIHQGQIVKRFWYFKMMM